MKKILIVGPSWVGDMVMAQSLFKLLKRNQDCEIAVLAPAWSEPVLARMAEVERGIVMPVGHGSLGLATRWSLGRGLRGQFDQAIVLPGSFKSALVPWFARIPRRTGFTGEQRYGLLNDRRHLDKTLMPFHLQRVAALGLDANVPVPSLEQIPWPALETQRSAVKVLIDRFGLDPHTPITVLCPGAEFGPAKQWPARHFSRVAAWCIEQGRQVLLVGSANDAEIAGEIAAAAQGTIDISGRTSLGEAIDLMSAASHVVSNDSGLMHIAAAVGARVIAIYGSSSDSYTPPLAQSAVRLSLDLDCQPCFHRSCPLNHLNCLNQLSPERVIASLN